MIKIELKNNFNLDSTVTCGQIFRYYKLEDNSYDIILKDRVINVYKKDNYIIASSNNEDDLFDWTEGWNGTNDYWYGKRTKVGNRGIEADNNSSNHLATPTSNPTINHLTLIGMGNQGDEPQAIKLRVGTFGALNNVVLSNWNVGFDVQHDESIEAIGDQLKVTGVKFIDVATPSKGKNTAEESVDVSSLYTIDENATGAGNGVDAPTWTQGWTVGL